MEKYITYYRVSTNKQNLGIDAQKNLVEGFFKSRNNVKIIGSYEEKESGKNNNRIELEKAKALCIKENATLVIAKLDRLSRDVEFLRALHSETDFKFIALDLPDLNKFTLTIIAAVAERERELLSERTKQALAVKKAQGVKLGSPENLTDAARKKGNDVMRLKARANTNNARASKMIKLLRKQGYSYNKIAKELNEGNFKTSRDKLFSSMQVKRLLEF